MSDFGVRLRGRALAVVLGSVVVVVSLSAPSSAADAATGRTMRFGDRGSDVAALQAKLLEDGLMSGRATGYFGSATLNAVKELQKGHGLAADGVVGKGTRAALVQSSVAVPRTTSRGMVGGWGHAVPLPWEQVRVVYTSQCTVTDVKTGLTFSGVRRGGSLHADTEPATAEDTRILKEIYGGTWSWCRRAVVVHVDGLSIAASMNGMPHGGKAVTANDFPGHFCIHFLDSRTHGTGRVDPDHQAMIRVAARY